MAFNSADTAAFKNVWVFCEQRQGVMMPTTFELISEGRKLANELGVELCGILLGDNVDGIAAELGEHGAVFLRLFAVDAGHEVERLALVVRHGHILQNGHRGARAARGILIDAADAAMALMLRHVGDVLVADEDFALVDRDGAADDVEQRRFARTVGADDADELPFRNGEGEIVEQAGLVDRAALVYLDDIAQLKHDVSPSFDDRPRR